MKITERMGVSSGAEVEDYINRIGLDSLRPRTENLLHLPKIERVVLVGSTSVGKSTLERMVRSQFAWSNLISVPRRIVTRGPRPDDEQMIYCTPNELKGMREKGEVGLYGVKVMENGRKEYYGYEKSASQEALTVFFANNQTLKNETTGPEGVLDGALIAVIYAPDDIRAERLRERSPQLFEEKPDEVTFRLSERAIRLVGDAHLIVKNYGRKIDRSAQDLIQLIQAIAVARRSF